MASFQQGRPYICFLLSISCQGTWRLRCATAAQASCWQATDLRRKLPAAQRSLVTGRQKMGRGHGPHITTHAQALVLWAAPLTSVCLGVPQGCAGAVLAGVRCCQRVLQAGAGAGHGRRRHGSCVRGYTGCSQESRMITSSGWRRVSPAPCCTGRCRGRLTRADTGGLPQSSCSRQLAGRQQGPLGWPRGGRMHDEWNGWGAAREGRPPVLAICMPPTGGCMLWGVHVPWVGSELWSLLSDLSGKQSRRQSSCARIYLMR